MTTSQEEKFKYKCEITNKGVNKAWFIGGKYFSKLEFANEKAKSLQKENGDYFVSFKEVERYYFERKDFTRCFYIQTYEVGLKEPYFNADGNYFEAEPNWIDKALDNYPILVILIILYLIFL